MKILIAGNSQALCLKVALDHKKGLLPEGCRVSFAITPGATGPFMLVNNGFAYMTRNLVEQPSTCAPEDALSYPIEDYDVVVISAVGYVDGGFHYDNPVVRQGSLLGFGPRVEGEPLVSDTCYRQAVRDLLARHNAVTFLRSLRPVYTGRILIQQFPYLSETVRQNPDWHLRLRYADPEGMHAFLSETASDWLKNLCRDHQAELISPPESLLVDKHYTAAHEMFEEDCMHPKMGYGVAVINQLFAAVTMPKSAQCTEISTAKTSG